MQIVTDSGATPCLPAEQLTDLGIHVVPLTVTLDGASYREGLDIEPGEFYARLVASGHLPTTSQPSAGSFAEMYRQLAATDPEILSVHISSGLSGTFGAAQAGAALVPEAHVTLVDTHTLSAAAGWQTEAAARAVLAGWDAPRILALLQRISDATDSIYTLKELRYLIHGGRISHMKGLLASLLNIKPMIGVEKERGTYVQMGQARSFPNAVRGLVDLVSRKHAPGSALRMQVLHSDNEEGALELRAQLDERFACEWLPEGRISMVLGAHTGPSMVGVAFAAVDALGELP
ncbi:MAG: DegV family protein [Chloroflexi bacterium]|nr:DegV family protein [Chloroflexota bacterium]